jgi:hypothetical protein
MRKISIFVALFLMLSINSVYSQGVGINEDGSDPDGSAILDLKSTTKGFLPPRMPQSQRDAITPVTGLIVYNLDTNKPNYYNGTEWMNYDGSSAKTLAIGVFHEGGVIFYLDGNGGGLVCAVSDQSTSAEWGCYSIEITGADGTTVGTGAQNTIDIETGCTTAGIAADICANLSLNGYDDWFLSSKDELNLMYQNYTTIDATALANGGGNFTSSGYWSSTEYNFTNAWLQDFSDGDPYYSSKDDTSYVRAVRAF